MPADERLWIAHSLFLFYRQTVIDMEAQVRVTCNRCLEEKDEEAFNWRWKNLNIRQRTCRDCQKEQKNDWYQRNSEKHKAKIYENKLRHQNEVRDFLYGYLSAHPCVDCGEKDIRTLEFDHVRGVKRTEIATLLKHGYSVGIVKKEIEKCQVVCANCHKKRTYKGSWRDRNRL